MKQIFILLLLIFTNPPLFADNTTDNDKLTSLLNNFLTGQSYAHHDRFWADDLIYTSSAGQRFDKKFIMDGIRADETSQKDADEENESLTTYSAEEIDIRIYGKTAIVAFKLVGIEKKPEITNHIYYYNTGTFLKHNNKWQAIAWQATKIPAK